MHYSGTRKRLKEQPGFFSGRDNRRCLHVCLWSAYQKWGQTRDRDYQHGAGNTFQRAVFQNQTLATGTT